MFRNFVYLNEDALRSYAEQLGIGNGKTTAKKFNLGAKAGPIAAGAEFEPHEQTLSLASLYNKFEKALESQPDEYFDFLTGNPDSSTLPPMPIVRFRGTAEVPESFDAIAMIRQYAPMLDGAGMLETEDSGVPKDFLLNLIAKKDAYAPLVMEGLGTPVFSKLDMARFADDDMSLFEELESEEAVFLFKVLSRCDGEQVMVYDPLRDFMKLGRAARRSMKRTSGLEEIKIAGPVIKGELIAIYH